MTLPDDYPDLNGNNHEVNPTPSVVITSKGLLDTVPVVVQAVTHRTVSINQSGKVASGVLSKLAEGEEPLRDADGGLPDGNNVALAEVLEGFAAVLRRLDKDVPDLPPIMSLGATPNEVWFQPWLACAPITALNQWENELAGHVDRRATVLFPE